MCGNVIVEAGEACDDGNIDDTDGCMSDCRLGAPCFDGVVDLRSGHCLFVSGPVEHAREVGVRVCAASGAYPVVIDDDVENALVLSLGGGDTYLGIADTGAEVTAG